MPQLLRLYIRTLICAMWYFYDGITCQQMRCALKELLLQGVQLIMALAQGSLCLRHCCIKPAVMLAGSQSLGIMQFASSFQWSLTADVHGCLHADCKALRSSCQMQANAIPKHDRSEVLTQVYDTSMQVPSSPGGVNYTHACRQSFGNRRTCAPFSAFCSFGFVCTW